MPFTRDSFWIDAETTDVSGRPLRSALFVERLQGDGDGVPFVLVHGGGGQGTDYLITPDGRPGWAPLLADRGHDVYVVDRVGHGRSPYDPAVLGPLGPSVDREFTLGFFAPPADGPGSTPVSGLHTQWPGDATLDDPVMSSFLASQAPLPGDADAAQRLDQVGLVQLLERIGPAVVVTHSAGGPSGFLVADARPDLVRALVAVEPLGPPFLGLPGMTLPWGFASAPLTYDPPASSASELEIVVDESGPMPVARQADPPRRLPSLAQVPMTIVSAEASIFRMIDDVTVGVLAQAGVSADHLRLWEAGVHGNGHGLIFELNNAEVLDAVLSRLDDILD